LSAVLDNHKYVREQNFGQPSMIQPNCTSLSKGSLRDPVRHTGSPDQPSGTSVNTNTCSIDAAQAHLRSCSVAGPLAEGSLTIQPYLGLNLNIYIFLNSQSLFCIHYNPPNVIILCHIKTDRNNRLITIANEIYLSIFKKWDFVKFDHIKRLINLTIQ